MPTGVPPVDGKVKATAEGHRIVDDRDLLVMDRADRMGAVDSQVHPPTVDLIQQRHRGEAEPDAIKGREQAKIGSQ